MVSYKVTCKVRLQIDFKKISLKNMHCRTDLKCLHFIESYLCLQNVGHHTKNCELTFHRNVIRTFSYFQKQNTSLARQRFHVMSRL